MYSFVYCIGLIYLAFSVFNCDGAIIVGTSPSGNKLALIIYEEYIISVEVQPLLQREKWVQFQICSWQVPVCGEIAYIFGVWILWQLNKVSAN